MVTMTPLRAKAADQGRGENKITEAGKSATLTIPIEGMSCASCVAKIEHGLSAVPGVSRAAVNLATEQATVEYQPGVTDPAAIHETIRSLGYTPVVSAAPAAQAIVSPESKKNRKQAAYRALKRRFWVAATLSVPVMLLGMSEHLGLPIPQAASFWLQLLL